MCHVSCVMCHVSAVTGHLSPVRYHIFFFFFQIVGAHWWRVCYQQGLPRLVVEQPRLHCTCERQENKLLVIILIASLKALYLIKTWQKYQKLFCLDSLGFSHLLKCIKEFLLDVSGIHYVNIDEICQNINLPESLCQKILHTYRTDLNIQEVFYLI